MKRILVRYVKISFPLISNVLTDGWVIQRYISASGSLLTARLVFSCCMKFQLVFVTAFFLMVADI